MTSTVSSTMIKWIFLVLFIAPSAGAKKADPKSGTRSPLRNGPVESEGIKALPETQLLRVDPHGKRGEKPTAAMLAELQACRVCHTPSLSSPQEFQTISKISQSCFQCHNSAPHSGVAEHAKFQITCSSCHSPHRGTEVIWKPSAGKFRGLYERPVEIEGLLDRPANSAMLKKTCTDCHRP